MCQQSVGLLQRGLDEAGVATVSITLAPEITRIVKPSLAVFAGNPFGLTMGPLHDRNAHRRLLVATLAEAERGHPAGTVVDSGVRWALDDLRARQLRKEAA